MYNYKLSYKGSSAGQEVMSLDGESPADFLTRLLAERDRAVSQIREIQDQHGSRRVSAKLSLAATATPLKDADVSGLLQQAKRMGHAGVITPAGRLDLRGLNLCGRDIRGTDLAFCDLSRVDLSYARATGTSFNHASLDSACLNAIRADRASFNDSSMRRCSIEPGDPERGGLNHDQEALNPRQLPTFVGSTFRRADLTGSDLQGANLQGADLSSARMVNCSLEGCDLTNAVVSRVDVRGAVLFRNIVSLRSLRSMKTARTVMAFNLPVAAPGLLHLLRGNSYAWTEAFDMGQEIMSDLWDGDTAMRENLLTGAVKFGLAIGAGFVAMGPLSTLVIVPAFIIPSFRKAVGAAVDPAISHLYGRLRRLSAGKAVGSRQGLRLFADFGWQAKAIAQRLRKEALPVSFTTSRTSVALTTPARVQTLLVQVAREISPSSWSTFMRQDGTIINDVRVRRAFGGNHPAEDAPSEVIVRPSGKALARWFREDGIVLVDVHYDEHGSPVNWRGPDGNPLDPDNLPEFTRRQRAAFEDLKTSIAHAVAAHHGARIVVEASPGRTLTIRDAPLTRSLQPLRLGRG